MRQERNIMKTINVNNLTLQFRDKNTDNQPIETLTQEFIDTLNKKMREEFPNACPVILSIKVGPEQIYVVD